jgi:hypothetical protein
MIKLNYTKCSQDNRVIIYRAMRGLLQGRVQKDLIKGEKIIPGVRGDPLHHYGRGVYCDFVFIA